MFMLARVSGGVVGRISGRLQDFAVEGNLVLALLL